MRRPKGAYLDAGFSCRILAFLGVGRGVAYCFLQLRPACQPGIGQVRLIHAVAHPSAEAEAVSGSLCTRGRLRVGVGDFFQCARRLAPITLVQA